MVEFVLSSIYSLASLKLTTVVFGSGGQAGEADSTSLLLLPTECSFLMFFGTVGSLWGTDG